MVGGLRSSRPSSRTFAVATQVQCGREHDATAEIARAITQVATETTVGLSHDHASRPGTRPPQQHRHDHADPPRAPRRCGAGYVAPDPARASSHTCTSDAHAAEATTSSSATTCPVRSARLQAGHRQMPAPRGQTALRGPRSQGGIASCEERAAARAIPCAATRSALYGGGERRLARGDRTERSEVKRNVRRNAAPF